jgi:hypothetical protein
VECEKDAEAEEENTALERRPTSSSLGFALCAGAGLVHAETDTGGNETDLVIPGGAGGVYVGVGVGVSIRRQGTPRRVWRPVRVGSTQKDTLRVRVRGPIGAYCAGEGRSRSARTRAQEVRLRVGRKRRRGRAGSLLPV